MKLYRIEEYFTDGWALIDVHAQKLTRERCEELLEEYMIQGYNPNYLRVVADN